MKDAAVRQIIASADTKAQAKELEAFWKTLQRALGPLPDVPAGHLDELLDIDREPNDQMLEWYLELKRQHPKLADRVNAMRSGAKHDAVVMWRVLTA